MMDDLVKRLRHWSTAESNADRIDRMRMAADRIEADEALLRQALERLEIYANDHCWPVDIEIVAALRKRLGKWQRCTAPACKCRREQSENCVIWYCESGAIATVRKRLGA